VTMYVGYEFMFEVVRGRIAFCLNVCGDIKVCIYVNIVHMVGLDRFVIVGNLYIMFGLS
jgi:hypothetical protein